MGQQCFGCQGYGHMKSECPTFLRLKGKVMIVTLSEDKVSDYMSGSDEDGDFIAFIATAIVDESVMVNENLSMGNYLRMLICKKSIISFAKDAMNVDLGLKKTASLELDKNNLLLKLFDAKELLNKVKTENMLLLDKVKNLEFELSIAREQTNRFAREQT